MRPQHPPATPINRRTRERAIAWLYTGPLGHLYSACTDIALLWWRFALATPRRRRLRRAQRSPAGSRAQSKL